jgi:4-diphosphocytidyl-2-C-methyl-D-erythritol kinase
MFMHGTKNHHNNQRRCFSRHFSVFLFDSPMMLAYAKINLGLYVIARRPDGYHDIETVFCRIGLADRLVFSQASGITVTSSSTEIPNDESNLCHKAARMLRDHFRNSDGVHIHITKEVPVGAGLGGGSADAALVLKELPAFWKKDLDPADQRQIALALGSDVPYFLREGAALGRGRGEQLEYFPLSIPFAVLLCNPNIHVATSWAYSHITPGLAGKPDHLRAVVTEGMRNPEILRKQLRNDFEGVVFDAYPEIRDLKNQMLERGAEFAMMSGSGSTIYGLFGDVPAAERLSRDFVRRGYRAFVTPPHFRV